MAGSSARNRDMTSHPVLDTIPSYGITKKEWRDRVERTGRPYTDPYVFRHSQDSTGMSMVGFSEENK